MDDSMRDYRYYLEKCDKCGTVMHVLRKPNCCGVDYYARWRQSHDISHEELERKCEQTNEKRTRHRKRKYHHSLPPKIKEAVLLRDANKCVKCGRKTNLQIHHIWHRKYGGSDDLANLETLCLKCHIKEHENEPIAKVMAKSL